ncbi:MAG TPA: flagellar hook-associated protein FlgL [Steroidobacteraceae bacterium]|nr:flagellar hook-associated protein FlgL [Steroidobacteraceae bacterium]
MRISTAMLNANALAGIEQDTSALSKTQNELATGKSINSPADNPVGAVQLLQLNNANAQYQQYIANGQSVGTNLNLEQTALSSATTTLQSIRDLVVQANNTTNSTANLQQIATQVSALENQLLGTANSQNAQGEYLFSGYSAGTQPFVRGASGAVNYVGDSGAGSVPLNASTSVQTGDPGSTVFMNVPTGNGTFATSVSGANTGTGVIDAGSVTSIAAWRTATAAAPGPYTISFTDATDYTVTDGAGAAVSSGTYNSANGGEIAFNGIQVGISGTPAAGDSFTVSQAGRQGVFASLDSLVVSLNTANNSAAARAQLASSLNGSLQQVDQALNQLSTATTNVGSRISLISSVNSALITQSTTLKTQISNLGDLDYAAASSQYSQQYVALQAAEQSYADIGQLSLFKYISGA